MLTRLPGAGILLCLLSCQADAEAGQCQETFNAEDYGEIVSDYMDGNYRRAALTLAQIPTTEQESAMEAYRAVVIDESPYRAVVIQESHVKAAVLLHTEVVMWTDRDEPFHIRSARAWIRELNVYRRRPFEKSWFLALGYFYMGALDLEAQPTLEAAARVFPHDVDVLLALGTCKETAGWMRRDVDALEDARGIYRDIVQREPEMAEAMIRMGRVLEVLDQEAEALRYLERGLDMNPDAALRLAALLTSGDIYRGQGDLDKAIERYRAAADLDPECQAAVVALSHALHESGDTGGSYEMVHKFFVEESSKSYRTSGPSEDHDLWWRYSLGHSYRLNTLLRELRKEVQQ